METQKEISERKEITYRGLWDLLQSGQLGGLLDLDTMVWALDELRELVQCLGSNIQAAVKKKIAEDIKKARQYEVL